MKFSPGKLNSFLMFKLPSAWMCGVRVREISSEECVTQVKHRWINQNPFNSLYFAVQAMGAELSTGALVMQEVQNSRNKISILVAQNNSRFTKKATGKITFSCAEGKVAAEAIQQAVSSGEGQTFWMRSVGKNEEGVQVSEFNFEWTVKVRS